MLMHGLMMAGGCCGKSMLMLLGLVLVAGARLTPEPWITPSLTTHEQYSSSGMYPGISLSLSKKKRIKKAGKLFCWPLGRKLRMHLESHRRAEKERRGKFPENRKSMLIRVLSREFMLVLTSEDFDNEKEL